MSVGLSGINSGVHHLTVNHSLANHSAADGQPPLRFLVNGAKVDVWGFPPQTTLLDFLRAQGLTGAKEGCAEGECGACNVVFVTRECGRSVFRAVNSCLMFLPMAADQEIYTVEGLAQNGQLSAVQKALAEGGGSQCGYCTPGFVMSLFTEYYRPGREGACNPHSMGGNLCRCTGYRPIRDAARSLTGVVPQDGFANRLAAPAPILTSVDYTEFDDQGETARFLRPVNLEECLSCARKAAAGDLEVKYIAGGTDLGVESNLRFRRWPQLISLEAVRELSEFTESPAAVRIGSALPLTDVGAQWSGAPPAFREWLDLFASPTLRNRATLGGNLATASPIGDSAPLLLALNAKLALVGPQGSRIVALDSFFTDYRKTVLQPGELIAAVEIPKPLPGLLRFYKIAKRQMDDISTVAAAFALELDSAGKVRMARFAFGGVAATPLRVTAAEESVIGHTWNPDAVERAQAALERALRPLSDHRGSAEYRLEVSKSLLEKFYFETMANDGAADL